MGGRAAETIIFDDVSTGAADDLGKATDIAHNMVTRFGMNDKLGPVAYEPEPSPYLPGQQMSGGNARRLSEDTAREIDRAVLALVARAYSRAANILETNKNLLEESAGRLLSLETLSSEQLPHPIKEKTLESPASECSLENHLSNILLPAESEPVLNALPQ